MEFIAVLCVTVEAMGGGLCMTGACGKPLWYASDCRCIIIVEITLNNI